jgi:hypothetical protein
VYTFWIFYSRSQRDAEIKRQAETKQAEDARKFLATYGSDEVKITQFYASPQTTRPGEKIRLCYGVLSAKTLRMEPTVSDVYPALSHCVQVVASKTTTYRLVAAGKDGKETTAESTVIVR